MSDLRNYSEDKQKALGFLFDQGWEVQPKHLETVPWKQDRCWGCGVLSSHSPGKGNSLWIGSPPPRSKRTSLDQALAVLTNRSPPLARQLRCGIVKLEVSHTAFPLFPSSALGWSERHLLHSLSLSQTHTHLSKSINYK